MSLYTPQSMIRRLILEAEELTLNPSPEAQQVEDSTSATPMDVASDMASVQNQAATATPGLQGSTLSMPQPAPPQTTVSKVVINKDIILAQLAELKSIVTNYEKQFEGEDLTPEDGNVYISALLSALVFHAEKFNAFMESAPGGEEALEAPAPPPAPEAPLLPAEYAPAEGPAPSPEGEMAQPGPGPAEGPAPENEAPLAPPPQA